MSYISIISMFLSSTSILRKEFEEEKTCIIVILYNTGFVEVFGGTVFWNILGQVRVLHLETWDCSSSPYYCDFPDIIAKLHCFV